MDLHTLAATIGLAEAAPHVRVWAWLANECFMAGEDDLTELAHNCMVKDRLVEEARAQLRKFNGRNFDTPSRKRYEPVGYELHQSAQRCSNLPELHSWTKQRRFHILLPRHVPADPRYHLETTNMFSRGYQNKHSSSQDKSRSQGFS